MNKPIGCNFSPRLVLAFRKWIWGSWLICCWLSCFPFPLHFWFLCTAGSCFFYSFGCSLGFASSTHSHCFFVCCGPCPYILLVSICLFGLCTIVPSRKHQRNSCVLQLVSIGWTSKIKFCFAYWNRFLLHVLEGAPWSWWSSWWWWWVLVVVMAIVLVLLFLSSQAKLSR